MGRQGENDRCKDYRTSTRSQIDSFDLHLFCILALCMAGHKEAARIVGMVTLCQPQSVITSEVTKVCCGRRRPLEGVQCLQLSGPDLCIVCRMPDTPQLPAVAHPVTRLFYFSRQFLLCSPVSYGEAICFLPFAVCKFSIRQICLLVDCCFPVFFFGFRLLPCSESMACSDSQRAPWPS